MRDSFGAPVMSWRARRIVSRIATAIGIGLVACLGAFFGAGAYVFYLAFIA